ncbi:MAG: hypothetical protein IJ325_12455 [Clostridia bacterium]|nr:hypothetical protein [Clostridia bacterium]
MRRYRRSANQKIKFVFKRILFVLFCAALIIGFAILTGNLLQNKVDAANDRLESLPDAPENSPETGDLLPDLEISGDVYSELTVAASGVILGSHATDDDLILRVNTVAETYDTVSVTLSDENGIVYTSPALLDVLRLPEDEGDDAYRALISLCTAAKAKNLRISGVLYSSLPVMEADAAALVDATLAGELYELGFDEVLFTHVMPEETDKERIQIAKEYLEKVRNTIGSGLTIGVVLPVSVYRDVTFTQQVQMMASAADFLAVDLTAVTTVNDEPEMTLEKVCLSLRGMFQVYNLRIILANPNMSQLAEQYDLLTSMELTNIQFLGEITPAVLAEAYTQTSDESAADTASESETSGDPQPQKNPYATSGSNNTGNTGDDDSAETYYQSGTSGSSWY